MNTPAIPLTGRLDVAATAAPNPRPRWRIMLAALLLSLVPALAGATEPTEWPTAPDHGPRTAERVPWMTFSGDPAASTYVVASGQTVQPDEVLVVREQQLTNRQRRLLRRADRKAEKAARLREKAGVKDSRAAYAVVVPVRTVQTVHAPPPTPPAPPAPPRIVYRPEPPQVHVIGLAHEDDDDDDCHGPRHEPPEPPEPPEMHVPVVIDAEGLSADVERQVERALRDAERAIERTERAHQQAERAHQQAERARERAERDRRRGPPRSRR